MQQYDQHQNGVNVTRLKNTIQAISDTPALGMFNFRATNRWLDGGHNRTTVKDFYGAGQEDTSRSRPFIMDADEPDVLLGMDRGANPVEFVLHALAACLTTSVVYHAAARGIEIGAFETELEGDLDIQGMLGLSDSIRKGYQQIRVRFKVQSDADAETLRELCNFSPVFDIVSNPVPVAIEMNVTPAEKPLVKAVV
jgi:uncharacterized OsmC-like protein